jgi:predicted transcriptional regulator
MREIKNGTLDDFFASAKETAREIDEGKKVTPKYIIWMETEDFLYLLRPARRLLLRYIRDHYKVYYSTLTQELNKSRRSLDRDLDILSKYQFINVYQEIDPRYGRRKVIESNFKDETMELRTVI